MRTSFKINPLLVVEKRYKNMLIPRKKLSVQITFTLNVGSGAMPPLHNILSKLSHSAPPFEECLL